MPFCKRFHLGKMTLFGALSVADLVLTWYLLRASGGSVYESNPFAAAWVERYGLAGLIVFKGLALLMVFGVILLVARYKSQTAGRLLSLACLVTGFVVAYSIYILSIASVSGTVLGAQDSVEADRKARMLDHDIQRERAYAQLLNRLVTEVVDGRASLCEAASVLAESSKCHDPRWTGLIQTNYPGFAWDACLALHLGHHVLMHVEPSDSTGQRLADRMADEFHERYGSETDFVVASMPHGWGTPELDKSHSRWIVRHSPSFVVQ